MTETWKWRRRGACWQLVEDGADVLAELSKDGQDWVADLDAELAGGGGPGADRRPGADRPRWMSLASAKASVAQRIRDDLDAVRAAVEASTPAPSAVERAIAAIRREEGARRGWTPAEVRALYDRLLAEGGTVDRRGRPGPGETPVKPLIAQVVGRSLRTVERMLSAPAAPSCQPSAISSQPAAPTSGELRRQLIEAARAFLASGSPDASEAQHVREMLGHLRRSTRS